MNQQHISKYFISSLLLLLVHFINAQETGIVQDSTTYKQAYGLRLGIDISRPVIQIIQKQDFGIELTGDYRVANSWYVASEIGYESEPGTEDYLSFHTEGSYAKIGFNYNAYENWQGMTNEVYFGLRYGYGVFSQDLNELTIIDIDHYFGDYTAEPGTTFNGLTAHWFEIHFGLKVEVFHNLYLTTGIQFKKLLKDDKPDGFANLYIPGFQKVLLNNSGVGFNYTISYLIPFKKK